MGGSEGVVPHCTGLHGPIFDINCDICLGYKNYLIVEHTSRYSSTNCHSTSFITRPEIPIMVDWA